VWKLRGYVDSFGTDAPNGRKSQERRSSRETRARLLGGNPVEERKRRRGAVWVKPDAHRDEGKTGKVQGESLKHEPGAGSK
jgi:hypothetical protein